MLDVWLRLGVNIFLGNRCRKGRSDIHASFTDIHFVVLDFRIPRPIDALRVSAHPLRNSVEEVINLRFPSAFILEIACEFRSYILLTDGNNSRTCLQQMVAAPLGMKVSLRDLDQIICLRL